MSSLKFRVNQYNWLGQKLLVQHRFGDILKLRHHAATQQRPQLTSDHLDLFVAGQESDSTGNHWHLEEQQQQQNNSNANSTSSDHLSYLAGLALMQTSSRLDELIYSLQQLNFQKNGQYLLLLCQCLLYLGHHDSVVALCKQLFNKEIDSTTDCGGGGNGGDHDDREGAPDDGDAANNGTSDGSSDWCLQTLSEESLEFSKTLDSIKRNRLIGEPKLWFVFAKCLEFQLQLGDAQLAYRVSIKLASKPQPQQQPQDQKRPTGGAAEGAGNHPHHLLHHQVQASNYSQPHLAYSEFVLRHQQQQQPTDFRPAIQSLCQALAGSQPIDYQLQPRLALLLSSQANANQGHYARAMEIVHQLDSHAVSTRNPSFEYNQLTLRCKQRLQLMAGGAASWGRNQAADNCLPSDGGDNCIGACSRLPTVQSSSLAIHSEIRSNLDYLLIRSHVILNNMVQGSSSNGAAYKWCYMVQRNVVGNSNEQQQQLQLCDKLIDSLRGCDPSCCSSSASLWNNLGVCYLARRRLVASLSCLTRAHQLSPLNWRINYNLGLVYAHVGLTTRATCCLLAAASSINGRADRSTTTIGIDRRRPSSGANSLRLAGDRCAPQLQLVTGLLATCCMLARRPGEALDLFAESVATTRQNTSVLTLINYLLLLGQNIEARKLDDDDDRELDLRLAVRLIDQLEQLWLQRSQSDAQFNAGLLALVSQASERLTSERPHLRRSLAWTKTTSGSGNGAP